MNPNTMKHRNGIDQEEHTMSTIDIGIATADRENIAQYLNRLLADSYTLYLQTHNFHWNVTGPQFRELHLMCNVLYLAIYGRFIPVSVNPFIDAIHVN